MGHLATVAIYNFFIVANVYRHGDDSAGMGLGVADGWRWATVHCRCDAPFLHYAPLVASGNGGIVASQLDSVLARQLAFDHIGALYLVVYPLRLFIFASGEKWG